MWINLSRRGWRKREPLDDSTQSEMPNLIPKSIKLLVQERVKTGDQIAQDLALNTSEIEKICELEVGFLGSRENPNSGPTLKNHGSKVIPFKR